MLEVRKLLNELLIFIFCFPFGLLVLVGADFAAKRYYGVELSHFDRIVIAFVVALAMFGLVSKFPRRVAVIMGVFGYLVVLAIWILG